MSLASSRTSQSRSLARFAISVRDIRMLRIEELNDLSPAVQQAVAGNATN